jgi:hypothetical protein
VAVAEEWKVIPGKRTFAVETAKYTEARWSTRLSTAQRGGGGELCSEWTESQLRGVSFGRRRAKGAEGRGAQPAGKEGNEMKTIQ